MKNIALVIFVIFISIFTSCKKPDCPDPVEPTPVSTDNNNLKIGLSAHYPFTGNAADSSGFANNGVVMNGAVLTTDRFGNANKAYSFDGVDDYINLPIVDIFMTPNYTYSVWVKINALPASSNSAAIIDIGTNAGDQAMQINNNYFSTTGWICGGYNVGGTTVTNCVTGSLPPTGVWYHFVSTRNDNSVKLYLNGVLQGTSSAPSVAYYGAGSQVAHFGARYNSTQYFSGVIDDVRIYNRALTADEVTQLYQLN